MYLKQTGYKTYGCDGTSPFSPLCSQFMKTTQCGEPTPSGLKSLCKSMYYDVLKKGCYLLDNDGTHTLCTPNFYEKECSKLRPRLRRNVQDVE